MGTWAAGNFDNDGALDYVGGLMDQLTNTVTRCFATTADLDEGGESELMPSIAIMKILSEQCGAAPPEPDVIEEWRSRYLAIYDQHIDDFAPKPEFKVERRKVIDETFSELIRLAKTFGQH